MAGDTAGILKPLVFGPIMLTKASGPPERPAPVVGSAFAIGKLPDAVSPATYTFNNGSSAMLVPISTPEPPWKLTVLGLLVEEVFVVEIRATKASVTP